MTVWPSITVYCHKYDFNQADKKSPSHFINKLRDKKQTVQQQKEAMNEIARYYEENQLSTVKNTLFKDKNRANIKKKEDLKLTSANRVLFYNDLNPEI